MNRTSRSLAVLVLWIVLLPCLTIATVHCGAVGTCLTVTNGAVLPPVTLLSEIAFLSLLVTATILFSSPSRSTHSPTTLLRLQNQIKRFLGTSRELKNQVFLL